MSAIFLLLLVRGHSPSHRRDDIHLCRGPWPSADQWGHSVWSDSQRHGPQHNPINVHHYYKKLYTYNVTCINDKISNVISLQQYFKICNLLKVAPNAIVCY